VAVSATEEQQVVQAVVKRLERDLGRSITLRDQRPDEAVRNTQAIDFLAAWGGGLIGVEHTRIEPFEDHLRLQAQMTAILGPLCDELDGVLPAGGQFELLVSADAPPRLRKNHIEPLRTWVITTAPRLGKPPHHFADAPDGLPIPARLFRWETPTTGVWRRRQLELRIGVDDALETLRSSRLDRAFQDKLPKLEDARTTHAVDETLLVLESDDFQVTNACASQSH
jgi:hypothetical protein